MIVVTTPTGDIGARVLRHVLHAGKKVRVVARNPARLPKHLSARVEVIEGSHADEAVIERALAGASAVFWLPPGSPVAPSADAAYVDFSRAFCTALPKSSVTHVVGISALGRGWGKPSGLAGASVRMDDLIGAAAANSRALACASLMDNILRQVAQIREAGAFYQPTPGELKLPQVAKADVARVAADLLIDLSWTGVKDVALKGPHDVSFNEMAATLSRVLERPIAFREMSMEQFAEMMSGLGASEGMVRDYVAMFTAKNEGMDNATTLEPRELTPTSFESWCRAEFKPLFKI